MEQAIVRVARAAERAKPVGRPGAVEVEAKAELPRRAAAEREPAEAQGEAQLVREAVVDRPAAGEGLPPRAAVGWRAVGGVLEAPPAKVALGLPPKAAVGWRAEGVLEAPLVKVALAGRRAAPNPGAVDNRAAAARRGLAELPPDRV